MWDEERRRRDLEFEDERRRQTGGANLPANASTEVACGRSAAARRGSQATGRE